MNCEDWQLLVEEYFDGELDAPTALKVRHHLHSCASCSSVLKTLSAEQSVYANYKSDAEISPELWAGIRQRIEVEGSPLRASTTERFASWLRNAFALPPVSGPVAVGLVVLAVVLTVVVMRYISGPKEDLSQAAVTKDAPPQARPTTQDEPAVVATGKIEDPVRDDDNVKKPKALAAATVDRRSPSPTRDYQKTSDPRRLVREAEQKYLAAIAMLTRSVDRRRSRLDPATVAELNQALSSIDRTIAATRKVVRRHPDDPVAAQYMLTAYAKKVDVLRELVDY